MVERNRAKVEVAGSNPVVRSDAPAVPVGGSGSSALCLVALGDYWRESSCGFERTEIGELLHLAKDSGDPGAAAELAERFARCAAGLPAAPDSAELRLVTAVPSFLAASESEQTGDRHRSLAQILAESLAAAGAGECRHDLVARSNPTPRMRHVALDRRAETAAAAGYTAREPLVSGRHIVLVDDVMLTGATLDAVAGALTDAGASSVVMVAAARTRKR